LPGPDHTGTVEDVVAPPALARTRTAGRCVGNLAGA